MKKFLLLSVTICLMTMMSSCDGDTKKTSSNPLLAEWDTPFGVPPFDKIKVTDYMPAFKAAMKEHNEEIAAIVASEEEPGFDNVILALDNSGSLLEKISNVFFTVSAAETNDKMQKVEEEVTPMISAHSDEISMNEALFAKIKSVYDRRTQLGLDPMQLRLTEKTYKRFERSGANLSHDQKEELKEINKALSLATFRFGSNLLAENARYKLVLSEKDVTGLPSGVRSAARSAARANKAGGDFLFDITKPSMLPFITYSDRRDLRQELYTAYIEKCNHDDELDNKEVINEIMTLRSRKAHLLGYESYADFGLDNVMAKTPANVYNLLDQLWTPALNRAKEELAEMAVIKHRETGNSDFESWDWWYYAEKVRKSKYNLDQEQLKPYFALPNVRNGIFELSNRLYGVTFRPIVAPVYHDECFVYEVMDYDGSHLGVLYMDYHPRPGKSSGAWCAEYRGQSYKDGERVAPVVTVVCNFTRPTNSNTPALLDLDEVETFFHEFGHALHALLSDVPYNGLRDVERDFVELPSQIMENWAVEPEMLRSYAIHYSSGKVIPDNLIEKIQNSATFNQGFVTTELLAASYIDMDIHTIKEYETMNVIGFEKEMLGQKRGLMPQIEPRYRYTYFAHIFSGGYSAGYYSYLWSEVLDKDAYQAFVESGELFNRKVATRFRNEILSKGGTADGMVLYENFRGRQPEIGPLLESRGLAQ